MDNKPISIEIEETKGAFVNIINTSGLPFSVIKLIVNELNTDVNRVASAQLTRDINEYNESLKSEEGTDHDND